MTRMVHELAHFDLVAAAGYNALALLFLPVVAWAYLAWVGRAIRFLRVPAWVRPWRPGPATIVALGAVVVAWGVARNLPWEPFVSLRV